MTTTRKPIPADLTPSVDNILSVYRRATADQVARGLSWYADAHTIALGLDTDNVGRAAGILAALSPRMPWARNITLAARVYTEHKASGTLGRSCAMADAIFNGADPDAILRGSKINAFWRTIADPTDPTAVVVDRHAVSVAIGRVSSDDDTKILTRKGVYEMYAEAYREAARIAGVAPSQMQAITWVVWREAEIRTAAANRAAVAR